MKKTALLFFISSFSLLKTNAQLNNGLTFGMNLCNVKSDIANGSSTLLGLNAGFFEQYSFNKRVFLNAELLYTVKGYGVTSTLGGKTNISMYYISIPTLFGYYVSRKTAVLFGPEYNYLTKAKLQNSSTNSDATSDFEKFDFGLDLAIKYKLSKKISVDLRYYYGLSKIDKPVYVNGQIFSNPNVNNRVFQINIFYALK